MRLLSVVISLVLHACLAVASVWVAAELDRRMPLVEQVYNVELVRLAPPRIVAPPAPAVPSPAAVPARVASAARAKPSPRPRAETPAPSPAAARPPAPAQPAAPLPPDSAPADVVAPQGKAIASATSDAAPVVPLLAAPPQPPADANATRELVRAMAVQEGDTTYVAGLRGFAAFADTFNLDRCGADSYTPEDYFGHYRVGNKRFVSVIDGRVAHDAFVFYDSRTGLYRKLQRRGEMIFTYGPSFSAIDPVVGSVTILPKKDRYDNKLIVTPAQLIWLPHTPPMQYGTRIEFVQQEVVIESGGAKLPGTVVMRGEEGDVPGVVLVFCTGCVPREQVMGFAQALALQGLAVLAYDVRTCGGGGEDEGQMEEQLAADALAALRLLRGHPGVDRSRVGLWGKDGGARTAVLAASRSVDPDFLVVTHAPVGPVNRVRLPQPEDLSDVLVPALFLYSGAEPGQLWQEHVARVERLRDERQRRYTVRLLPDATEAQDPDAEGLKPLSMRYGREAAPWIQGLGGG